MQEQQEDDRPNFAPHIGDRISIRRRELKLGQKELGEMFGVSREMISQIETGRANINAGDLPRLAKIMMVPISYFYGGIEYPSSWLEGEIPIRVTRHSSDSIRVAAQDQKKLQRGKEMRQKAMAENALPGTYGNVLNTGALNPDQLNPDEEELVSFYRGISSDAAKRVVLQTAKSLFEIEHQVGGGNPHHLLKQTE